MTKIVRIESFLGKINSFLLIGRKVVIVDSGFSHHYKNVLKYLYSYHISKDQVSLIILTHAHIDHYDNINKIRERFNVPILATEAAQNYFRQGANEPTEPTRLLSKAVKFVGYPKKVAAVAPDIAIKEKFDLRPFGVDGFVILTPGHTKGSLSIIVNGTDCLTADLLRKGKTAWFIENRKEHAESVKQLKNLNIKIVHPSHGGKFNFGDKDVVG